MSPQLSSIVREVYWLCNNLPHYDKVAKIETVGSVFSLSAQCTTNMVQDPRISRSELAAINAAAVTKEYYIQPHIGEIQHLYREEFLSRVVQSTGPCRPLTGKSHEPCRSCSNFLRFGD
jgi:hypothetical protein